MFDDHKPECGLRRIVGGCSATNFCTCGRHEQQVEAQLRRRDVIMLAGQIAGGLAARRDSSNKGYSEIPKDAVRLANKILDEVDK